MTETEVKSEVVKEAYEPETMAESEQKLALKNEQKLRKKLKKASVKLIKEESRLEYINKLISIENQPKKLEKLEKKKKNLQKKISCLEVVDFDSKITVPEDELVNYESLRAEEKRKKREQKRIERFNKKREKIFENINRADIELENIKNLIAAETDQRELKKHEKQKKRIEERLKKLEFLAMAKSQRPLIDKLRIKIKKYRILIIVVLGVVFVTVSVLVIKLYNAHSKGIYFSNVSSSEKEKNRNLESEITVLKGEISTLKEENKELLEENETLDTERSEYKKKADFMDKHIKVVEDDKDKTYHTYGCKHFDGSSFWAYNSEQVVKNSKYKKCPYCN